MGITENKIMNKQFYEWIIDEWSRKNEPEVWLEEVWIGGKINLKRGIRLWEHKCGKYFTMGDIERTSKR